MKNKYADMLSNINIDQRGVQDSVLILDGLNTFLRAFTMINHINPEGHHVGGLTGFLKSLGYAIKMIDPTKVIIVFDGVGGSNSRRNLFPDYKANRNTSRMTNYAIFSSKEDEREAINNQMARLINYLQCLPVSMICVDGIEADDTIGYLVGKFEKFESILVYFLDFEKRCSTCTRRNKYGKGRASISRLCIENDMGCTDR
jgi:5'-3' exonuclease